MDAKKLRSMDEDCLYSLQAEGDWSEEDVKEWAKARGISYEKQILPEEV